MTISFPPQCTTPSSLLLLSPLPAALSKVRLGCDTQNAPLFFPQTSRQSCMPPPSFSPPPPERRGIHVGFRRGWWDHPWSVTEQTLGLLQNNLSTMPHSTPSGKVSDKSRSVTDQMAAMCPLDLLTSHRISNFLSIPLVHFQATSHNPCAIHTCSSSRDQDFFPFPLRSVRP